MIENDEKRFAELLTGLAASFGVETNPAMISGYWMGLDDLTIDQLEQAIRRSLRDLKWFPKPIELRKLAGHMTDDQRAIVAWGAVNRAIREQGSYRSVDFDDPIVNAAIRNMGGWTQLCAATTEDLDVWRRKEFERIYQSLRATGTSAEACAYLSGHHEVSNSGLAADKAPLQITTVATGLPLDRQYERALPESEGGMNALIGKIASSMDMSKP